VRKKAATLSVNEYFLALMWKEIEMNANARFECCTTFSSSETSQALRNASFLAHIQQHDFII